MILGLSTISETLEGCCPACRKCGGVTKIVLTGTSISIEGSKECLGLCQTWFEETGVKNVYATIGIHHMMQRLGMDKLMPK